MDSEDDPEGRPLRSRNDNDFGVRYAAIAKALQAMPDESVIDGEIVALDDVGRPSFNVLQNYGSSKTPLIYYPFDVMVLAGESGNAAAPAGRQHPVQP